MTKKPAQHFIALSNRFLQCTSTKEKFRMKESDFTRNRKLPFELLALCMLQLLRKSIQSELHLFFKSLNNSLNKVTASAFVQSRKKMKADLFYELNHLIASDFYQDNDEVVKLFKGLRILAVDGSTIHLPIALSTKEKYGMFNNQKETNDVVIARVSVLYDVLNEIAIDGLLRPFSEGEVSLSREHLQYAQAGDLIIMDRAYASFESAYLMQQKNIHFLFRCKHAFSNQVKAFYESGKAEQQIEMKAKQNKSFKALPYTKESTQTVRLLRVELPNGEVEILMTSLLDVNLYPHNDFKNLYFQRWNVETFYNRFKNIISVENFSGTSHQFIQQEFNCALYMSNMQTILTHDAQEELKENSADRKYEYKVNHSMSLGFIREQLVTLYSKSDDIEKNMKALKELFVEHSIPIRPNRSFDRDIDKYRQRTKPKQFKNKRILM